MTTRVGAVGEETTGTGVLLRSGGRLEAFPIPLGSERTLGLAGPYGTPLIGALPAPADPAGGRACAKACPDRTKLPSMARTSAIIRDIGPSGSFNDEVGCVFPRRKGRRCQASSPVEPATRTRHSITSSASADRDAGIVSPSSLAVVILIRNDT